MAGGRVREPDPGVTTVEPCVAQPAAAIPLSLYVHIPWCERKCPYCDFNSHAVAGPIDHDAYVATLLMDLHQELQRQPTCRPLHSIFIGGGTPSLLEGSAIARLLDGIAGLMQLRADTEITLEANPGSAEAARFAAYRAAGVNRLSIGVQSLDDTRLAALGRVHNARQALAAYAQARDAGFENINLDLMYGLPSQSIAAALADLDALIALAPDHLSWYQLTLEPHTWFHHSPPPLPDDDALASIMDEGLARLDEAGYRRYEISALARPGLESRHNLNYWQYGDYLGIGAGAHGKLTLPDGEVWRSAKQRQPDSYIAKVAGRAVDQRHQVAAEELPVEFFLNALRLTDGVPAEYFRQRTGQPLAAVGAALARARGRGLLEASAVRLRPTALGQRYLNDLLLEFEVSPPSGVVRPSPAVQGPCAS